MTRESVKKHAYSLKSSPNKSSPSSSSASLTASRSSRLSSVSEKGAGGEDGGREDSESRRLWVLFGGDKVDTGDVARLLLLPRGVA
jgi:hypothetical protein